MIDTRIEIRDLEASGISAADAFAVLAAREAVADPTWHRLEPPGDLALELEPWLGERLGEATPASVWVGLHHYGEDGRFADFVSIKLLDVCVPVDPSLDPDYDDALSTRRLRSSGRSSVA